MIILEIKVNDYVRTKQGNIFKIIGGNEDNYEIDIDYSILEQTEEFWYESNRYNDNGYWFDNENVVKSSPNIIDLIKVGDVLIIKDFVDEACMIFTDIYLIQNETQLLNIKSDLEKNKNKKLYSIVTKERIEQMEYKIN